MQREEGGDEEIAPEDIRWWRRCFDITTREGLQQQEQEGGVGAMEGDVDHMRATGVEAENLTVEHVRDPGERVPVIGLAVHKRPFYAGPSEAGANGGVVVNVVVVVVSHELEMARGPINGERGEDEERTGENLPSAAWAGGRRVHAGILGGNGRMPRFFIGDGDKPPRQKDHQVCNK